MCPLSTANFKSSFQVNYVRGRSWSFKVLSRLHMHGGSVTHGHHSACSPVAAHLKFRGPLLLHSVGIEGMLFSFRLFVMFLQRFSCVFYIYVLQDFLLCVYEGV